jgi:hypothetical protein
MRCGNFVSLKEQSLPYTLGKRDETFDSKKSSQVQYYMEGLNMFNLIPTKLTVILAFALFSLVDVNVT